MGKYFGTDGIRGIVNEELDASLAFKVGMAAAMVLAEGMDKRPLIAVGKDTRISCDMLEAALISGLCAAGADVMPLGVVPTPTVAFVTKDSRTDAGIVISASHNPYTHNGIKIFNSRGFKLSDELEDQIEELIDNADRLTAKKYGDIGRVTKSSGACVNRYIEHILSCADHEIKRYRVLIDCSNGAATRTAKKLFSRFPIDLKIINDQPDGLNINHNCGSTHASLLSRKVVEGGFDVGFAFDGDADRCIAVDETGGIVDGDKIMAVCGLSMKEKGQLKNNSIVATVMSNLGFHEFAGRCGIKLQCTPVGDRNVLEKMLDCGYNLGGEQSGHLIFLDDSTTGDGQLAAVKFLSVLSETGRKVSDLMSVIPVYPQILENVPVEGGNTVKQAIMEDPMMAGAIRREEKKLGDKGRILVRPSGTEAFIRVMVEADQEYIAKNCTKYLANLIKNRAILLIN